MAMEFLTPKEIQEIYKFTPEYTYKLLQMKNCPVLPRCPHAPYLIIKDKFEPWLESLAGVKNGRL